MFSKEEENQFPSVEIRTKVDEVFKSPLRDVEIRISTDVKWREELVRSTLDVLMRKIARNKK